MGITAAIGLATYVGWWVVSSHTPPWIRHPSPGLLAFAPMLVAVAVAGWWALGRTVVARGGAVVRVAGGVAVATIAASVVAGVVAHVTDAPFRYSTLAEQREWAADIAAVPEVAASDWIAVGWGEGVSVGFLAGKHVGLTDAGASVADYPWIWAGDLPMPCDERAAVPPFVVCAAPGG